MAATHAVDGRPTRSRFLLFCSALLLMGVAGCSDKPDTSRPTSQTPAGNSEPMPQTTELSPERMAQWSRNCALCHVRGEGGAPVLGDRTAWGARWLQGEATLLRSTVEGLNNMPPLGYCMDCEEDDFLALIRFMGAER